MLDAAAGLSPRVVLVIVVVVLLLLLIGYTIGSQVTGFGRHVVKETETLEYDDPGEEAEPTKRSKATETQTSRTFWDWMTVLTISAVIGVVGLIFTWSQQAKQQEIQDQQAKDAVVQAYFDQMTQMMLDDKKPLLESEPGSPERLAARVHTVTALKRLDGEHNRIVTTFLKESGLVNFGLPNDQGEETLLRLDITAMDEVKLANNSLSGVNLRFAQLRGANLHDTNLTIANLSVADLAGADLTGANLRDAGLLFANLDGADLSGANFMDARLRGADLRGADLKNAENLTQDQIDQVGATDSHTELPKGIDAPEWWGSKPNEIVTKPVNVPMLRHSGFGASLVALKSLKPELRDEIDIPEKVGNTDEGPTGVLIYDVGPGSIAQDAGFRAGDVIVKVGQNQVRGLEDLKRTLDRSFDEYEAGRRVKVGTWRLYFRHGWQRAELYPKFGH